MSDTPRTDAIFSSQAFDSHMQCVNFANAVTKHAMSLERELTLAQSERDKAESVCEILRKAQAFIKSEQDDEVAALRTDADRKTALICELRVKISELQQRLNPNL